MENKDLFEDVTVEEQALEGEILEKGEVVKKPSLWDFIKGAAVLYVCYKGVVYAFGKGKKLIGKISNKCKAKKEAKAKSKVVVAKVEE